MLAIVAAAAVAASTFVAGDAFGGRHSRTHARSGTTVTLPAVLTATLPGARVTVYGDSLISQSVPYLKAVGTAFGLTVTTESFAGTAPCDFLPNLERDLSKRPPDVVVWAFSGNSIGTCMIGTDGQPLVGGAILARYRDDVLTAAKQTEAAGSRFVVVSPPTARSVGDWSAFDAMYRGLAAADSRIDYVDGGVEIAPDGHFTSTEVCLPFETQLAAAQAQCTSANQILVRATDGVHFCQFDKQMTCPGYSSGAMRYSLVILGAVRLDVDYRYVQRKRPGGPSR